MTIVGRPNKLYSCMLRALELSNCWSSIQVALHLWSMNVRLILFEWKKKKCPFLLVPSNFFDRYLQSESSQVLSSLVKKEEIWLVLWLTPGTKSTEQYLTIIDLWQLDLSLPHHAKWCRRNAYDLSLESQEFSKNFVRELLIRRISNAAIYLGLGPHVDPTSSIAVTGWHL